MKHVKTLEQLIAELRVELKMIASLKLSELSDYPPSVKADMHHITNSMRRNNSLDFTERTAAEIIHFASAPNE